MLLPKYSRRRIVEAAIIVLFVIIFLSVHVGRVWDYKIEHEYPYYFNANDNFFHSELSDYVKEKGNYDTSPYYVFGGYTDVEGYLPPLLYHLSAGVSLLAGMETYDTTYMVTIMLTVFAALLIFFSIRRVNEKLALLSLPFMIGIFAMPFEIPYAWGLWIFLMGAVFFMSVVWYLTAEKPKYSFLILAVLLSGAAFGHASELIFSIGLIAVYLVIIYFITKKLDQQDVRMIIISLIIFGVISAYYLLIFYFTYMTIQPFTLSVMEAPVFAPNFPVNMDTFGYIQYLLILGLLVAIISLVSKDEMKSLINVEKTPFLLIAIIYVILIGFTNYIGFGVRAFQMRTIWPILLAALTAMPIYTGLLFVKMLRFRYVVPISVVLLLVLASTYYNVHAGTGMMDKETWDAFKWIGNNTEKNSKIFWFYSLPMVQEFSLFSSKRIPFKVSIDDYVDGVNSHAIKNTYNGSIVVLTDAKIPFSRSITNYGYHMDEDLFKKIEVQNTNSAMDYYVFGLAKIDDVAINYNKLIVSKMLESNSASVVFSNSAIVILKTNRS
jgi:hypothetical protein